MAPPVAVYVAAAVVGAVAIFAFKEFVYEPHLAPRIEAWAEGYIQRRRAARNRRASAVPVGMLRRHHSLSSPSNASHDNNDVEGGQGERNGNTGLNNFPVDGLELEALTSREVDEWRNEVLRSQERPQDGLRKRRTDRVRDSFDGSDSASTTLDESFTQPTHTPVPRTQFLSNVSSPFTPINPSLPQTPTRRPRSVSQSTATLGDDTSPLAAHSLSPSLHQVSATSPSASMISAVPTPRPFANTAVRGEIAFPTPVVVQRSHSSKGAADLLPSTPTYQVMADDCPFGPILPDTPRSMAEMYGERPFSPITRVMGPSPGNASAAGPKGTLLSRTDSMNSLRTVGGSGVSRKRSRLVNELMANDSGDEENESHNSFTQANTNLGMNGSVISSLSERYPAPQTPPVIVSPPTSSIGIISAPSSPHSGHSEVAVHQSPPQALPLLVFPVDSSSPRLMSRSQSPADSAMSPALSYASFLSPIPIRRGASGSEADEFLSIASDDSEWGVPPMTPGEVVGSGSIHDRPNDPFIDFERPAQSSRGFEHAESEGSEVIVGDVAQEDGSEVGSDESWGSARRN